MYIVVTGAATNTTTKLITTQGNVLYRRLMCT